MQDAYVKNLCNKLLHGQADYETSKALREEAATVILHYVALADERLALLERAVTVGEKLMSFSK